jgi:serine-type D-Ala-D-Ala carboxypeptidase/endopeptidase (penicillin-binding protein 4)
VSGRAELWRARGIARTTERGIARTTERTLSLLLAGLALTACAPRGGPATGVGAPPVITRSMVAAALDSLPAQEAFRSAHWGILVVNPRTGDTLASRNAGKLFIPASNVKLVTGAVALAQLGAERRVLTVFGTNGRIEEGVLIGDLVVSGGGDPGVSARMREDAMIPLREIADSLAARGITRIDGSLIRGVRNFAGPTLGSGWQWDYLNSGYASGVDDLFFNEGLVRVTVYGTSAGEPPMVVTSPASTYPQVHVNAMTAEREDSVRQRIEVLQDTGGLSVTVEGTIAPGDTVTATVVPRDPAAAYMHSLFDALRERGIRVSGAVRTVPDSSVVDTLFTMESPPMAEIVRAMMKPSQNQIAEILIRIIGREITGVGHPDSGLAVIRRQLDEWGVASDGSALRDGSGLSRNDLISPKSIVRILDVMRGHEQYEVFHESLPLAGVDGTVGSRMRGTPAANNLRAKTGTLSRASALSGYVTTADGELLLFSFICNNFTTPASAVTGMQNEMGVLLASMRWGAR